MEMLTLFMKRGKSDNSNKGLEASDPDFRLDLDPFDPDQDKSEIVNQRSRSYDGEDYEDLAGLDGAFKGLNTFEYAPCPTVDFNGARLLYFANYQDILDRAEWMQFRDLSLEDFSTSKRHIKYFGNVDSRDTVRVEFMSAESTGNRLVHEAALLRGSDGKVIAEVETEKTRR
jgi:probable biosynthetic protein (TIGR04098 family)